MPARQHTASVQRDLRDRPSTSTGRLFPLCAWQDHAAALYRRFHALDARDGRESISPGRLPQPESLALLASEPHGQAVGESAQAPEADVPSATPPSNSADQRPPSQALAAPS